MTATLQLGSRLGFASGELPTGWCSHMEAWAYNVLTIVKPPDSSPAEPPGGAAFAPAWCAARAEAFRLLPLLAAVAPHVAGLPSAEHPALPNVACAVMHVVSTAAAAALRHMQRGPSTELASTLARLFEAACRAVHWAAGQPAGMAELLPWDEQPLLSLLGLLDDTFRVVAQAHLQGIYQGIR